MFNFPGDFYSRVLNFAIFLQSRKRQKVSNHLRYCTVPIKVFVTQKAHSLPLRGLKWYSSFNVSDHVVNLVPGTLGVLSPFFLVSRLYLRFWLLRCYIALLRIKILNDEWQVWGYESCFWSWIFFFCLEWAVDYVSFEKFG